MSLNKCTSSSTDNHNISLDIIPDDQNTINQVNCPLTSSNEISNMSGDSLYLNEITNSDKSPSSFALINQSNLSDFNSSTPDCSTSYDDNNISSHDNSRVCEIIDTTDVVTTIELLVSTDNPSIYANDRQADNHELNSSTNLALSNGSQPGRVQYIDNQYSTGIYHPQL